MDKPKIKVILGSIREGRMGIKVAEWFMQSVKDNPTAELELLDLLDYPLPLYADSNAVKTREGKHPNPAVQKWIDKIEEGNGYIFITPEYNHSYSSVLKNAIDYIYKQWNGKPVGFVSYGGYAGGSRAVEHLRQVTAELKMYGTHDQVLIPLIWSAWDDKGSLKGSEAYAQTANSVVNEVSALALKLK
jgi:NAD(P)H-dependent FMN reductase